MGIASDTYAQMTRDMWAAWVSTFMPIENTLIDYSTNRALPGERAQQAMESVREAFDFSANRIGRGIAGVPESPLEREARERDLVLSKSLAQVNAANVARQATVQRQRGIMGIPMPVVNEMQAPVGR